jgi:hypothetical protein
VRLWNTEPLRERNQARRKAAALRCEAEPLVEQLRQKKKQNPQEVVEALRGDATLSEPLRQVALRAVLRRAQPPTDVPGKPHDSLDAAATHPLARGGPPHVRHTSARFAIPPICGGHIDMRIETDVGCSLRSGTRRGDRSAQASGHGRARRVVPRAVDCPE